MREFQVFFHGIYIGRLYISENGQYMYCLNDSISKEAFKGKTIPPALFHEQLEFGDEIPFFMVRIEANDRFRKDGLEIGLAPDEVRLKEVF